MTLTQTFTLSLSLSLPLSLCQTNRSWSPTLLAFCIDFGLTVLLIVERHTNGGRGQQKTTSTMEHSFRCSFWVTKQLLRTRRNIFIFTPFDIWQDLEWIVTADGWMIGGHTMKDKWSRHKIKIYIVFFERRPNCQVFLMVASNSAMDHMPRVILYNYCVIIGVFFFILVFSTMCRKYMVHKNWCWLWPTL